MASLDSLPPDQRAVLQLVLQRGRSYDEIAQMLSIDRAAVRERALAAFDALGPGTRVPPERRALITDYLLGQLPQMVAEDTRRRLGESAAERAWARVVASELGTLSSGPLPEIPVEAITSAPEEAPGPAATTPEPDDAEAATAAGASAAGASAVPAQPAPAAAPQPGPPGAEQQPKRRRTSRRGGAVLLAIWGVLLAAAIVVAVILLTNSGSSSKHSSATTSASVSPTTTSPASGTTTSTSTTATTSAKPVARVIMTSPTGNKKLAGAAVVVTQGSKMGIVIRATGLTANTSHDAYAVWLSNSPTDSRLLGFVNPGVKSDGVLQAGSLLPSNVSHFKQLLITLETVAKPHQPGQAVLKGPLNVR